MRIQRTKLAVILLASVGLVALFSCQQRANLPAKSSKEYNEAIKTFYVGLAALQVGDDVRADAKLTSLTQLVPDEPAGWGNWGVLALRQRNFDVSAERLERARSLAPENDQIQYLIGLLESARGRSEQAAAALKKAIELNPKNLYAINKLAEETERLNTSTSLTEVQGLLQKIIDAKPNNLAALVEHARIAAKRGDTQTLQAAVGKLSTLASSWPPEVQQQFSALQTAANSSDSSSAAVRVAFLRNVLVRVPAYRRDLAEIKPPPGEEAEPFTALLKLPTPVFEPAAPDLGISFDQEPVQRGENAKWGWIGAISLNGEGPPTIVLSNGREVVIGNERYPFPSGPADAPPSPISITPLDFNYDFKTDLVLTGPGGLRLLKQEADAKFVDVTAETKLPQTTLTQHYSGSWAADIDADGDLDIVVGADAQPPKVLRNNGDGSFSEQQPFTDVVGLSDFVWADIDGDGDPDAALVAGRKLFVFSNERSGQFNARSLPADLGQIRAISSADLNQDGMLDLIAIKKDGSVIRISDKDETGWDVVQVASLAEVPRIYSNIVRDEIHPHLSILDLDNNGANDLLVSFAEPSGAGIWLNDKDNKFTPLSNLGPIDSERILATADINNDGRLDLLGITDSGAAIQRINHGKKNYHWQVIRPKAAKAVGDQRINSFGVGGEMEIRAGLLLQKQLITGPIVHFGLGEQTGADVVRIVWPNGAVRAEFETKADQAILAEQRLKGSCPFLFAYNGKQMQFVKDAVPWSSAIGLRINTLGTARVEATEEWYKIRGDQLVAKDGFYDLRITAELWETYYYDQLGLMVVDHPSGTQIFVDERFVIPPAKLEITTVETPHRISRAIDDNGQDVTESVTKLDGTYLDTFGRGRYQGVTRDHFVEVDLGEEVPQSGSLYLIAHGWMHPTDSSVNVAISQGNNQPAKPLSLEVPDGNGGWVVARPNLGFPAGRNKISLIDLTGVFRPGTPHRIRLRTTLEIYWDLLEWAKGIPATELKTTHLNADIADLHFRGYSVMNQANDSSPEVPDYNHLAGSKQGWRDLIGYYTRFGDVRELLERADDRYVIMNSGDEMTFRFREQPEPPAGWVRDYVIFGDGWIKDGDYNSTFSKTVLPLPYHARQEYTEPPTSLENEWVFKKYPSDWQTYHTRFVTPEVFQNALRIRKP